MNSYRHGRFGRMTRSPRRGRLLDYTLTIAVLGLFIVAIFWLDRVESQSISGTVTINDGDTVTINGERIRLLGIDAPEYNQSCTRDGKKYACGSRAHEALARLIGGRAVTCTGSERDRYDRFLGVCSAGGKDLNRALVAAGWAVAYGEYFGEEKAAKAARLGMWAGEFDRPADWRRMHGGRSGGNADDS